MRALPLIVLATLAVAAAAPVAANEQETRAEVPALTALHEVIYPLWHEAWPAKNHAQVKELIPALRRGVQAVAEAELPGILRDKQPRWDEGVAALQAAVKQCQVAAMTGQEQPLLDAVEEIHARYEALVRLVRPPMKELDVYHQVLYRLYHHDLPDRNLLAVKAAGVELAERCSVLAAAELPKRAAPRAAVLKAAFGDLCNATESLRQATGSGDWATITTAIEAVHTTYQQAEGLLE